MKKYLLLTLLSLSIVGCSKTIEITEVQNRDGIVYEVSREPFTGKVIEKYPNGQLAMESTFQKGQHDGVSKTWYENGALKSEATYDNGYPILNVEYYENGRIKFYQDDYDETTYENEPINFQELTESIAELEKEIAGHKKTGEIGDGHHFGWQIALMQQYLTGLYLSKDLSSEDKSQLKKLEDQLEKAHKQAQKIWANE